MPETCLVAGFTSIFGAPATFLIRQLGIFSIVQILQIMEITNMCLIETSIVQAVPNAQRKSTRVRSVGHGLGSRREGRAIELTAIMIPMTSGHWRYQNPFPSFVNDKMDILSTDEAASSEAM
jgi:hypothetical protein